jgi:uncharacterized membrane protein
MSKQTENLSTNPSAGAYQLVRWVAWIVGGTGAAFLMLRLFQPGLVPGSSGWPEVLLLFSLMAVSFASLSRQLPAQNILLAAAIAAVVGSAAHAVSAATGIPFGPITFTNAAGPELFSKTPVAISLVWIVLVLCSRGVARLIMRPWRKTRSYGYWLIGLTVLLAGLLAGGVEPFASRVQHYWFWGRTRVPVDWYGAPVTAFLAWMLVTLLIMAFTSPVLSKKRSSRQSPPDYHPLAVWLLLVALCGAGAGALQLWSAVGYCAVVGIAVAVVAIRGGKW